VSDPTVKTTGFVREISPTVDQATGTVQTKIALDETPPAMTLGATVTGTGTMRSKKVVILPWNALFSQDGGPAVWVVDAGAKTVSLKPVEVARFETGSVVVSGGLDEGDIVVTAGGKLLRPNQVVAIAGEAAK
jgi:multidrug efflux pump subunit AcrA (membrane-fusion protein)